jgi:hypothetical protein
MSQNNKNSAIVLIEDRSQLALPDKRGQLALKEAWYDLMRLKKL